MEKKTDLRVLRTRKMLWESLVQLIEDEGFDSVTVADIAAKAMVNRATFYRHYESKDDLLQRGTARVVRELAAAIRSEQSSGDLTDLDPARKGLRSVLDHVDARAGFYRTMLCSVAGTSLRRGIQEVVDDFLITKFQAISDSLNPNLVPPAITAKVVSSVIVGLISWWIEEEQPVSKPELIECYLKLMVLGPYQCLGFEKVSPPEILR